MQQIIHKPDMQCHLMVSSGSRKVVVLVQCVRVVRLNWVKVQCMAYCKVGVCSRVYYFWLFIVLIAWGEKLFLSRLVWDRMLRRRLPEGSRESSLWDGVWNHWWSSGFSLYTAWCRCPGGREDPLQSRFMSCFRSNSHVGSAVSYTRFAQGVRVSAPGLFVH